MHGTRRAIAEGHYEAFRADVLSRLSDDASFE